MGAGKFRGGAPYTRSYRFLEEEAVLQIRSDRRTFRPYGLWGGEPGEPSRNALTRNGVSEDLPSKFTMTIRKGDIYRHDLAGAGGWGDPLEREPAAVVTDVRNELLSVERAAADYGVVVDTARWAVDAAATEARRSAIRAARGDAPLPAVDRGEVA